MVKGNLPCQALADVPWWEKCLKEQGMTKADFSFEEIKAEVKKISEEKGLDMPDIPLSETRSTC